MAEKELKYGYYNEIELTAHSPASSYFWSEEMTKPHRVRVGGYDPEKNTLWDGFKVVDGIPRDELLKQHAEAVEIYKDAALNENNLYAAQSLALTYNPECHTDICSVEKSYEESGKWLLVAARLGCSDSKKVLSTYPELYNPNGEDF